MIRYNITHPKSKAPTKFGLGLKPSSAHAANFALFGLNFTVNSLDVSSTLPYYRFFYNHVIHPIIY